MTIEIDYDSICEKILGIDNSIRFAAIYGTSEFVSKIRGGTNSYLSNLDTDLSLNQALSRWQGRKRFKDAIGLPEFSLTKYNKVYRITLPFQENNIIAVSTEPNADVVDIITKVQKLRDEILG